MGALEAVAAAVVKELLGPLVSFIATSEARKTIEGAKPLRFWSDGMLKELREIANENTTSKTYENLNWKMEDTDVPFNTAVQVLSAMRNNLGGGPLASALDECLYNESYGKKSIREHIQMLLDDSANPDNARRAKAICNQIEAFNAAMERMRRLLD